MFLPFFDSLDIWLAAAQTAFKLGRAGCVMIDFVKNSVFSTYFFGSRHSFKVKLLHWDTLDCYYVLFGKLTNGKKIQYLAFKIYEFGVILGFNH